MVLEGGEATGSMGADTPLSVLSQRPQLLYSYFKQLFAQVTNPPVDALREEVVMDEDVMLGAEGDLLEETPQHAHRLRLKRPIITNEELEKIRSISQGNLLAATISAVFPRGEGAQGLEPAMARIFDAADAAIKKGVGAGSEPAPTIIILSDREVSKENVPIPTLLACAGLHHHLISSGTRTRVSLVLETGEAREMHHFAVLIGYGANAINPYLAFETIEHEILSGNYPPGITFKEAHKNYIKSTRKGIFKIISKMGISTIQSYCGAQIFEAVGMGKELVDKYFTATPSRIGGIRIETVAEEAILRHDFAYRRENVYDRMLDEGGFYAWRLDGEHHQLNPEVIALLQYAVRTGNYEVYKQFAKQANEQETNLASIRGLLKFKKGIAVPLEEVEPATEIVKRFATGAMSYGSISKEAHETLAIAMNRLKGFSNTGEGGEEPERYLPMSNGDSRRSRIKQVAQGRFGVTIEYLVNSDQMQIKMAQGAKPGKGGSFQGIRSVKRLPRPDIPRLVLV